MLKEYKESARSSEYFITSNLFNRAKSLFRQSKNAAWSSANNRDLSKAAREYFTLDEARHHKGESPGEPEIWVIAIRLERYNTPRSSGEEEIYWLTDKMAILLAPRRWDVRQASNAGSMGHGILRNVVKSRTCQQRPAACVLDSRLRLHTRHYF